MARKVEHQHDQDRPPISGRTSAAFAAAKEAIDVAQRTPGPACEIQAHGVRARALLCSDGAVARAEVESAFLAAETLIERTGARIFTPMLREWRAELAKVLGYEGSCEALLRQAADGFEAIGAPLQAARIRREART